MAVPTITPGSEWMELKIPGATQKTEATTFPLYIREPISFTLPQGSNQEELDQAIQKCVRQFFTGNTMPNEVQVSVLTHADGAMTYQLVDIKFF